MFLYLPVFTTWIRGTRSTFKMSENSQELLKETVFHLLSHNQQFNAAHEEIVSLKSKALDGKKFISDVTELNIVPLLRTKAQDSSLPLGNYGPAQCANKLLSVVRECKGQLLSDTQKAEMEIVIATLRQLMMQGCLDTAKFGDTLCQGALVPMEMLVALHREGLLCLEDYITKHSRRNSFVTNLLEQLKELSSSKDGTKILTDIVCELMELGYGETRMQLTSVKKVAASLLDNLVQTLLDETLENQSVSGEQIALTFSNLSVDLDLQRSASLHLLTLLMTYKPVMKVSKAFQDQSSWTYGKLPSHLIAFYKQLLVPFDMTKVLEIVWRVLDQQEINWQLLLSLVSVLVVCLPEASNTFLDFTDRLLQEGVEGCDQELTIVGLLLARQACHHGPHVFLSYPDWFQRTFSDGSRSLASSRKSFSFFMKFLSDIMPYESAVHIKVHILRPLYVPAKCRPILADYIVLAKTRLADLNESLDVPGSEGTSAKGDAGKVREQLEEEVSSAVASFEATGKVPTSILEASIFRKPYYIGQFLPALLKPRPLPDRPDCKMKLIAALKKADKIPGSMLTSYEKACRRETMQLLEGVFIDSDSEDMELSPLDQLETSLGHLTSFIQSAWAGSTGRPKHTLSELVPIICEKIEGALSISPVQSVQRSVVMEIDTHHLVIPEPFVQVTDVILNNITATLQSSYRCPDPSFTWLTRLLQGVAQYPKLQEAMCKRIWELTVTKGTSLEDHHIDTIAAILVEYQLIGDHLPRIQMLGSCRKHEEPYETITEAIFSSLKTNTAEWMATVLRLISMYIKYLFCAHEEMEDLALIPVILSKYVYLSQRLYPHLRYSEGDQVGAQKLGQDDLGTLLSTKVYRNIGNKHHLGLEDWALMEIHASPDQDTFTSPADRHTYHEWAIYQNFLPQGKQEGGAGGDYHQAASILLKCVLDYDIRLEDIQVSCPRCSDRSGRGRPGSVFYIINLIQHLTGMFTPSHLPDREARLPWLLQQLLDHVEKEAESETGTSRVVLQFFRLFRQLPSYLMYSNTPQGLRSCDLDGIADVINTVMTEQLSEGLYLPVGLTAFLLHGLNVAVLHKNLVTMSAHLFELCPSLILSAMVNFSAVESFVKHIADNRTLAYGSALYCLSCGTLDPDLDPWLGASVIFSILISSSDSCQSVSSMCSVMGHTSPRQVLLKLSEMLLLQLAYCHTFSGPQDSVREGRLTRALTECMTVDGGASVVSHVLCGSMDDRTAKCVSKSLLRVLPYTLLRYLGDHQGVLQLEGRLDTAGLTNLLQHFVAVTALFESPGSSGQSDEICTLPALTSITKALTNFIQTSSPDMLRQIDQELVFQCGPGVSDVFIRALQYKGR